ncbi:MAG: class I SAM-dependent methyltransferase [Sphaerochaetaceae bacterium]|nr:class I SAM-dependent methyltransferase [Sphaerochaetaceae bacterium]
MKQYIEKDFGKILKRHSLQMRRLMKELDSDVGRIYDRNLQEIPITVDLYGAYARLTDYSDDLLSEDEVRKICDVVSRNAYIEPERVIYHKREKRESGEQHGETGGEPLTLEVKENGLLFLVDLTSRIDTGLFLDQMPFRKALKDGASGKRVLNLFSYTGSFSVYAAAGGAASVVSVDLSKTYSDWGEKNLKRNGFFGDQFTTVNQDALTYIDEARNKQEIFDVIIFDPPSFSNSRKMEGVFDVQKDHAGVLNALWDLLSPSGVLYFSMNLHAFRLHKSDLDGFKIEEVTSDYRAPGFSSKKMSLRSWVLTKQKRYHKGGRVGSNERRERSNHSSSSRKPRNEKSASRFTQGGKPEHRSDGQSDSRSGYRREGQSDSRGGYKRDGQSDSRSGYRREGQSDSRGGYKRDGQSDSRGGYKRDGQSDSRGGYKRDGQSDSRGGYKRDGQSDSRGGYKRDGQSDSRGGYRRDGQSDSRGGYKRDGQSDSRGGYRREGQSDSRGGYRREGQSDSRGGYRGDGQSDSRGGYKRDGQSDSRDGYRGDGQSDSRGGYKRDGQSDSRGGYKRDGQSDSRGGYKRDGQSDSRGGYRREGQTDSRGGYRREGQSDSRGGYRRDGQTDSRGGYRREGQSDSRGGYRRDGQTAPYGEKRPERKESKVSLDEVGPLTWDGEGSKAATQHSDERPQRRSEDSRPDTRGEREDSRRPRQERAPRPYQEREGRRESARPESEERRDRAPRKPKLYGFDAPKRSKRSSDRDDD